MEKFITKYINENYRIFISQHTVNTNSSNNAEQPTEAEKDNLRQKEECDQARTSMSSYRRRRVAVGSRDISYMYVDAAATPTANAGPVAPAPTETGESGANAPLVETSELAVTSRSRSVHVVVPNSPNIGGRSPTPKSPVSANIARRRRHGDRPDDCERDKYNRSLMVKCYAYSVFPESLRKVAAERGEKFAVIRTKMAAAYYGDECATGDEDTDEDTDEDSDEDSDEDTDEDTDDEFDEVADV